MKIYKNSDKPNNTLIGKTGLWFKRYGQTVKFEYSKARF